MSFLLQLGSIPSFFAEPLVMAGLGFAIALSALSYMASEFFTLPSLKAFSKLELRELLVTVIAVLLIIGLAMEGGVYDSVAKGMALPDESGNPPTIACEEFTNNYGQYNSAAGTYSKGDGTYGNYAFGHATYFLGCRLDFAAIANIMSLGVFGGTEGVLLPELIGFYREFMFYEMMTGIGSTFTLGIELPELLQQYFMIDVHLSNIVPLIFLAPINEAHTLLVDIIGALVSATAAQHMLLDFVQVNVPKVVLPLGVAMRAFPFTRKAGSTIIAFAFVAYFIYPLTILLNERIYNEAAHTKCPAGSALLEDGGACEFDSDCCSNNCVSNECRPMLGDFTKFASTYAVCGEALQDVDQEEIQRILNEDAARDLQYQEELRALDSAQSRHTKSAARQKENLEEAMQRNNLLRQRQQNGLDSVFITPSAAFNLMQQFELMVSETGRLLVLHTIFIVMEILLTLTILKDISIMIGGEPRLLGMSKLV